MQQHGFWTFHEYCFKDWNNLFVGSGHWYHFSNWFYAILLLICYLQNFGTLKTIHFVVDMLLPNFWDPKIIHFAIDLLITNFWDFETIFNFVNYFTIIECKWESTVKWVFNIW
jgi:hypothetical protein